MNNLSNKQYDVIYDTIAYCKCLDTLSHEEIRKLIYTVTSFMDASLLSYFVRTGLSLKFDIANLQGGNNDGWNRETLALLFKLMYKVYKNYEEKK